LKKDNTTGPLKIRLRNSILREFAQPPRVFEAYGGLGHIYSRCYAALPPGVVIDKDRLKAENLAAQRPEWRVYEGETVRLIREGIGGDLPIGLLDLDPYGTPWPAIKAWFASERNHQPTFGIVVQDGLRAKLQLTGGWDVADMRPAVEKWGVAATYRDYLDIVKWMMDGLAEANGYAVQRWTAYHTGAMKAMTHYAAILARTGGVS